MPSGALRLSVSDFLFAFWARKLVPISIWSFSSWNIAELACKVAVRGVFNLDDLCTEERQMQCGKGARENIRQVKDPNSRQGFCHSLARSVELLFSINSASRLVDHTRHFPIEERC